MKRSIATFIATTLIGVLALAPAAKANGSFEFLFSASRVSNDDQYFLHLAVGNYGYPRTVIEPILPRLRYVESDLPVVLFLARSSGRSVDFIVSLRERGASWNVIFDRCGVAYDVLFVDIERDPGPPYGKAWGQWRKNPKRCRLSDQEIAGLVQVQTAHRVTRASAFEIARVGGRGETISVYGAEKKGRPHAKRERGRKGDGKRGKPRKGKRRT
jgi:hypothetical protein